MSVHTIPVNRRPSRKVEAQIVFLIDAAADAFEKAENHRKYTKCMWYDSMSDEEWREFDAARKEANRKHAHAWRIGKMCGVQLVPEWSEIE